MTTGFIATLTILILPTTNTPTQSATTVKMKGGDTTLLVHFKGDQNDFFVYVDDLKTYKKWQDDKSIPMAHFVAKFDVYVTEK